MDNSQASDTKMMSNNNSPVTKKFYDSPEKLIQTHSQVPFAIPFDWDEYLKRSPALVAPKEAFMQSRHLLINKFQVGMKLEARDPKKNDASAWSLATVVAIEGSQRIRLRFDGSDSMSDIFELINSNNIKPLHSNPILYPPMAYRGNIANYSKFVHKVLGAPGVVKAPQECFIETPDRPPKNLFKVGMKIEALDRKNVHLIYPATIGEVLGDEIRIIFDGWKGSFDYTCKYYSREIFPINWCRDNNHPIAPPKGWEKLMQGQIDSLTNLDTSGSSQNNVQKVKITPNISKNEPRHGSYHVDTKTEQSSTIQMTQNNHPNDSKLKVKHTPKRKLTTAKHLFTSTSQSQPTAIKFQSTPLHKTSSQQASMKLVGMKIPNSQESGISNSSSSSKSKVVLQSDESDVSINMTNNEESFDLDFGDVPISIDLSKLSPLSRTIPYPEWREKKKKSIDLSQNELNSHVSATAAPVTNTSVIVNSTDSSQSSCLSNLNSNKKLKLQDSPINNKPNNDSNQDAAPNSSSSESRNFPSTPYQTWSVKDVINLISSDSGLAKYSNVFIDNEIDGNAFVLLTTEFMKNHMGLKLGPVLKINQLIERAKQPNLIH